MEHCGKLLYLVEQGFAYAVRRLEAGQEVHAFAMISRPGQVGPVSGFHDRAPSDDVDAAYEAAEREDAEADFRLVGYDATEGAHDPARCTLLGVIVQERGARRGHLFHQRVQPPFLWRRPRRSGGPYYAKPWPRLGPHRGYDPTGDPEASLLSLLAALKDPDTNAGAYERLKALGPALNRPLAEIVAHDRCSLLRSMIEELARFHAGAAALDEGAPAPASARSPALEQAIREHADAGYAAVMPATVSGRVDRDLAALQAERDSARTSEAAARSFEEDAELRDYWAQLQAVGWLEEVPQAEVARLRTRLVAARGARPSCIHYGLASEAIDLAGTESADAEEFADVLKRRAAQAGLALQDLDIVSVEGTKDQTYGILVVSFRFRDRRHRFRVYFPASEERVLDLLNQVLDGSGQDGRFFTLPASDDVMRAVYKSSGVYARAREAGLVPGLGSRGRTAPSPRTLVVVERVEVIERGELYWKAVVGGDGIYVTKWLEGSQSAIKLDRQAYREIWRSPCVRAVAQAEVDGVLFASDFGRSARAFDAESGRLLWAAADTDAEYSLQDGLLVAQRGRTLDLVEPRTGRVERSAERQGAAPWRCHWLGPYLLYSGSPETHRAVLLDVRSGEEVWAGPFWGELEARLPPGEHVTLWPMGTVQSIATRGDGFVRVTLASPGDGPQLSPVARLPCPLKLPTLHAGRAYWHVQGRIVCVDLLTGAVVFDRHPPGLEKAWTERPGVIHGDGIAYPVRLRGILVFSLQDGEQMAQFDGAAGGGQGAELVAADDRILVPSGRRLHVLRMI